MKKSMFGICVCKDGNIKIEAVNGYLLDYGCFRFGIRKIGKEWSITELSTGKLIGLYAYRKRDIIPMLDKHTDLLTAVKKLLDSEDKYITEAQEMIREFYTAQSRE